MTIFNQQNPVNVFEALEDVLSSFLCKEILSDVLLCVHAQGQNVHIFEVLPTQ